MASTVAHCLCSSVGEDAVEHHAPEGHVGHMTPYGAAGGGHAARVGHEEMLRRRFWVCVASPIPVLALDPSLQRWLDYTPLAFPSSAWITPVLAVAIFCLRRSL
ncbi:MAG: hypothetical protein ACUVX9_01735 [Anaerolineae bacterium]